MSKNTINHKDQTINQNTEHKNISDVFKQSGSI